MKHFKYIMLPLAALLVLASAVVVSAQGPMPPQGTPPSGQPQQGQPGQGQGGPQGQGPQGQGPQGQGQGMPGDWAGVVQAVGSSSLTVLRANNETFTAVISSTTKIELMTSQSAGTISDIQTGNNVTIDGRKNSDGSVAAARVMVEPSGTKVAGAVTAVSGANITLTSQKDTVTVVTSSSTKFLKGKETASLSDVTKGTFVAAYGTKQSDGSISAKYVIVNSGPGAQGQPGQVQGQGQPARNQTPPSQSTRAQTPQAPPPQGQPLPGDWAGVVQTVSSSKLTVLRPNSETFTATITSTTKVELMVSQSTGSVSDIQAGNNVTIEGRRVTSNTVAASRIMVEPSGTKVAGSVSAVSGVTITLTTQKDKVTVVTSSSTTFLKGTETSSLSDVTKGAMVTAYGTKQTDGSVTATYVVINGAPGSQGQGASPQNKPGMRPTPTSGEIAETDQDAETSSGGDLFAQFLQWLRGRLNFR